jgi:hypothetical protein
MCFSATASFIAGISLSILGVATVKMAGRKAEIPFAMIPLLFGAQQIVEGMLWLSFQFDAPLLNVPMTYLFTLFSHVLWPIYVPFSIGLMECVVWRKKVISAFQHSTYPSPFTLHPSWFYPHISPFTFHIYVKLSPEAG